MILFIANVILALAWSLSFGPFTPANTLVGFVLGYICLRGMSIAGNRSPYFARTGALIGLSGYFLWEMLVANIQMAVYTLSPLEKLRPAILKVPLDEGMSDLEITTLANMVTLTPGTLSIDISTDKKALFVHFMHVDDAEAMIQDIRDGFMRRILAVSRDDVAEHTETRTRPFLAA